MKKGLTDLYLTLVLLQKWRTVVRGLIMNAVSKVRYEKF